MLRCLVYIPTLQMSTTHRMNRRIGEGLTLRTRGRFKLNRINIITLRTPRRFICTIPSHTAFVYLLNMAFTFVVEKDGPLPSVMPHNRSDSRACGRSSSLRAIAYLAIALVCAFFALWTLDLPQFISKPNLESVSATDLCLQPSALTPIEHAQLWQSLSGTYGTDAFVSHAIDWLGGAIRVP